MPNIQVKLRACELSERSLTQYSGNMVYTIGNFRESPDAVENV